MRTARLLLTSAIVILCLLLMPAGQTMPKKPEVKPLVTFELDCDAMLKSLDDLIVNQRCTVYRIQKWLEGRGAGYAPYASLIEANGRRTGINPYLCVAVGEAESNSGAANCGSLNPWGMLGCSFGSWEDSINSWFDNCLLHWGQAQDGYALEMNGNPYCETNRDQYASNVTNLASTIANSPVPVILMIPPSFWRELNECIADCFDHLP